MGFGRMPATGKKRFVLRMFISLKYVTANVVDRGRGRVVATASSVEKDLKANLECGRFCNAKAAAAVGEVLALRLKVDGLAGEEIHADLAKEMEKKGFKNITKVRAIVHALRSHGVNLIFDPNAAAAAAAAAAARASVPSHATPKSDEADD
ncbi:ribosomal L18p/L5e family protein [Wolffia australiana]